MTIAEENQPQKSGERFPDIFQNAPFAIFEIDYTIPRFIRVNRMACELSGYTEEEFLSLNPITWLNAESSKSLQERIKQGLAGQKIAENVEFKLKAKDGHDVWVRLSVKPTYMNSKLVSALIVGYDVTESKKAQEAALYDEGLLKGFFDSPGLMRGVLELVGNQDIRHIRDNIVTANYFGLTPQDLENKLSSELGEPIDRIKIWLEHCREAEFSGEPVTWEYADTQGGKQTWLSVTVTFLRKASNGNSQFTYAILDISEHKKAEEAVQQEKDRLMAVVNSIPDEVWFADINRNFTLANPSAVQEFTLKSKQTGVESLAESLEVRRPDGSLRPVDEAPPLRALRGEVIKDEEEIIRTPASGELKYRQVSSAPVKNSKGIIVGSVSVVRDITERKKAEKMLDDTRRTWRRLWRNAPNS